MGGVLLTPSPAEDIKLHTVAQFLGGNSNFAQKLDYGVFDIFDIFCVNPPSQHFDPKTPVFSVIEHLFFAIKIISSGRWFPLT